MVSATNNPRLWRVDFTVDNGDTAKSVVVCYVYLREAGLKIYYHCHELYARAVATGPWHRTGNPMRQEVNPSLAALIHSAVLHEIWSLAQCDDIVSVFPIEPDEPMVEESLEL